MHSECSHVIEVESWKMGLCHASKPSRPIDSIQRASDFIKINVSFAKIPLLNFGCSSDERTAWMDGWIDGWMITTDDVKEAYCTGTVKYTVLAEVL